MLAERDASRHLAPDHEVGRREHAAQHGGDLADEDAEAIYTDEWPAYRGIEDANTRHETVNHRAEEWVHATYTQTLLRAPGRC